MIFLSRADQKNVAEIFASKRHDTFAEWDALIRENVSTLEKFQPAHFELFKAHVSEIPEFKTLIELLTLPHPENPIQKTYFDVFISRIDDSAFDFRQWTKALGVFQQWLTNNHRSSSTLKMLGYLECCASSIESKDYPLELKDICLEMLKQHGYLG